MFEFSIAVSIDNAVVAKKILGDIKKSCQNFGAVITSYSENDKVFVVVACEEIEKQRLSFFICDAIADSISTFYKLQYIDKNLNLPIQNSVNLKAFKKALVAFDRETDKYIITRNLRLENDIYIDSFYQFRMGQLRRKWAELIKLANDNASYLLCNDTFIDLLKFLIENLEISSGMVNVVKGENGFKICDEAFNEIEKDSEQIALLNMSDEPDNEAFLITSLIALSPRKINVYCDAYENSPALTLISQIFENRVCILPEIN